MDALFVWSLKSSAILIVLFACYYFLFRHNTAFKLRRTLLLAILCLSCIAPLLQFEVTDQNPVMIQKVVELKSATKVEIGQTSTSRHVDPALLIGQTSSSIDWNSILIKIYITGIVISLSFLFFEIGRVIYLKISGTRDLTFGTFVFQHARVSTPFSFYRWIFIPLDAAYDAKTWEIIQQHEQTHIKLRHSLDILNARLLQSIMWFNPIIYLFHKELRAVHEAQADAFVLQNTGFTTYAQTLLQMSMPGYQLPIGHSFAVISSLSKRLKLMKTHKTKIGKTIIMFSIFSILTSGIIGWTTVKGQDKFKYDEGYKMVDDQTASVKTVEGFNNFQIQMIKEGGINKVIRTHSKVLEVLKKENIEDEIYFQYFRSANFHPYFESYKPGYNPLYVTEINDRQKLELYNLIKDDTLVYAFDFDHVLGAKKNYFTYSEKIKDLQEIIQVNYNYLMIYAAEPSRIVFDETQVLDPEDVDELPKVMGGIENLSRTIALDITIPENLDRTLLPETIDFEFVVQGGQTISHLDLLTELKGSDKKNKPYYLFFGEVHNALRGKVASLYPWKRGIKDGKEVLVRMKISIPTKYMM